MKAAARAAMAIAALFLCASLSAESAVDEDYGWSLDLPEGYFVAGQSDDGMSILFEREGFPVSLAARIYEKGKFKSARESLEATAKKLPECGFSPREFSWRNVPCAICSFSSKMSETGESGLALAAPLPESGAHLVLLCYAPQPEADANEHLIVSILNSLAIDRGSLFEPGPVTSVLFPAQGSMEITLEINGRAIKTSIDKGDEAAADFAVLNEYRTLALYAGKDGWQEAWRRYYRAIFRDSFSRLRRASADISRAMRAPARKLCPKNEPLGMARVLLEWTQGFTYEREGNEADFTSLPSALAGKGCDCDSRALLLCALLENMGTKCALFVSQKYSHALFGAAIENDDAGENCRLDAGGESFLLGETTARGARIGTVAREMSDSAEWLGVALP